MNKYPNQRPQLVTPITTDHPWLVIDSDGVACVGYFIMCYHWLLGYVKDHYKNIRRLHFRRRPRKVMTILLQIFVVDCIQTVALQNHAIMRCTTWGRGWKTTFNSYHLSSYQPIIYFSFVSKTNELTQRLRRQPPTFGLYLNTPPTYAPPR